MLATSTARHGLGQLPDGRDELTAIKALVAALESDVFTDLAAGPLTCAELSAITGVAQARLRTLLDTLTGIGLTAADRGTYSNAPTARRWLVRGAPDGYGAYFRLMAARQLSPPMPDTDAAWHVASLRAARTLARRLPIRDARALLDVGGGSGAFPIAFCDRNPALRATLLARVAMVDLARHYCAAAGLGARVGFLAGDALSGEWPPGQDVVVMSHLLSVLGAGEVDVVLARALDSLRPGGLLVVHDVMLDDDGQGPAIAAMWFLQQLASRPDGISFSAAILRGRLRAHGLLPTITEVLIPGLTTVVLARKKALS